MQFHVARRNRAGRTIRRPRSVLISVSGRDAYQSANWYVSDDQVPTWHYEAVEIEGEARLLDEAELVAQVDRLSERDGGALFARAPWTRAKMDAGQVRSDDQGDRRLRSRSDATSAARASSTSTRRPTIIAATVEGQPGAGRDDIVAAIRGNEAGHEQARGVRLRRDPGRQRRDHPCARWSGSVRRALASPCPPPRVSRRVIGLSLLEAMAALLPRR